MDNEREILAEQVLEAQRVLFLALQSAAWRDWQHLHLSMVQMKAIYSLAHHGTLTVSQMAEELGVGKPAASILLERLVQLGYIERAEDAADRRRSLLRLTLRGEELIMRLHQGGRERLLQWLDRLDLETLQNVATSLQSLAQVAAGEQRIPVALQTS